MNKLYILIRKDLGYSYGSVQAGHAVAEWMLRYGQIAQEWGNGTLVYLAVEDEQDLILWSEKLNRRGMQWAGFNEPDMEGKMTTIACFTDSKIFSNLKLFNV